MSKEKIELVRGSGNVFQDFGFPNAAELQRKALKKARALRAEAKEAVRRTRWHQKDR